MKQGKKHSDILAMILITVIGLTFIAIGICSYIVTIGNN
jgi:hypothetical protein